MRVVAKIGTSSLTDGLGVIDASIIDAVCDQLAQLRAAGHEVILVSSGAVSAGVAALGLATRPTDVVTLQAISAAGQSRLMEHYNRSLGRHSLVAAQVLLVPHDFVDRRQYLPARQTLVRLLELGCIPIVNENDAIASDEIRYGDNDRIAALVAHNVAADLLVLLTDVDGLYTANPRSDPDAQRIAELADIDDTTLGRATGTSTDSTGGMASKLEAARIAAAGGIPVVLAAADDLDGALEGRPVGTYFHTTGKRRARKLLWLAYASRSHGELVLDDGAVAAVMQRNASLLPAGVTGFRGDFHAGDPVRLVDSEGTTIARGIVNYEAADLPTIIGRTTRDLAATFGAEFERELVHRDALILKHRRAGA